MEIENPNSLISEEKLAKARSLPRPTRAEPTGLLLPSARELEDARWQQDYAGKKFAAFVADLQEALKTPPANNPAARAKHEKNLSFLRTIEFFLTANTHLLTLLDKREEEMCNSMAEAEFTHRQMRLDRDFHLRQLQSMTERYYQENDLAAVLERLNPHLFQPHDQAPLQPESAG